MTGVREAADTARRAGDSIDWRLMEARTEFDAALDVLVAAAERAATLEAALRHYAEGTFDYQRARAALAAAAGAADSTEETG